MPYLLDSDYVIDYLQEVAAAVHLYPQLALEGISMSVVTYMEAYEGTLVAEDRETALRKLDDLESAALLLDFDQNVAKTCGQLRVRLRAEGKRVNPRAHDLQIAATALFFGLTLVTRNRNDYADTGVAIRDYSLP